MKKLSNIARELKNGELVSELEALEIKGGRRYVTKSYNNAMAVLNLLKGYGYRTHATKHGDNYCIEW